MDVEIWVLFEELRLEEGRVKLDCDDSFEN